MSGSGRLSGGWTRLLPVTKAFGPEAVLAVLAAGHRAVGENYAQELLAKHEALGDRSVEWHMIGNVQRNKVRRLVGPVAVWQTIDQTGVGLRGVLDDHPVGGSSYRWTA